MERITQEDVVMRTWKIEVNGHQKIGRPKLKRRDVIIKDTKKTGVKREESQDCRTWRMKTRCTDPNKGKAKDSEKEKMGDDCRCFHPTPVPSSIGLLTITVFFLSPQVTNNELIVSTNIRRLQESKLIVNLLILDRIF